MEERSLGGSNGASSSPLLSGGGQQRFEVELKPGETTIVSWKKLVKDANKAACSNNPPHVLAPPVPPVAVNQALDSLNAPSLGGSVENEAKDAPHGSRFGTVVEKIERLYMGKNSSDEEDLNDVPDDDEYDTEDSFIDDTELDEYFQVDNSAIKHDGFFVNRGKLERTTVSQNEPINLPNQQPKKRRRKDSAKLYDGNDGQLNNQKVNNNAAGKVVEPEDKKLAISSQSKASSTINSEDIKYQSGLLHNNSEELNQSLLIRDKDVIRQQLEAKAIEITQQTTKNPLVSRKEGSYSKPKRTMLEKAIRDLEKIVVESRPPSMEVANADSSSPAVKRRMPPEIKHKLAKVARLAHAIQGKISKELLNRLMSIVGHLIQLRSLRRNLMNMVNTGLSAKEEKDSRMQQLKKQINEMVKIRAAVMKSKAMEQKEKEVLKRKFTMDDTLEDIICDLYDLFVEGLDEDAGPQVRKLYAELAEMWPQGVMDNHGIRRAICRAKDRRKALQKHKDEEKLKKKRSVDMEAQENTAAIRSISNTLTQQKLKGNNQNGVTSSEMSAKKAKRMSNGESFEAQIQKEN